MTSLPAILRAWTFPPVSVIGLLLLAGGYARGTQLVRRNSGHAYPRRRRACFFAGVVVLALCLLSPIDTYSDLLLSVHMAQHLLMTMVAAPLLLLGGPVTLALQSASPEARRRYLLPVLHSRIIKTLTNPVVAWCAFAVVMWGSHFTPLYERALENQSVHAAEHLLYLGSALMFWWPVVGIDPAPSRLSHPARILYLFLAMPQTTFLGLAIYGSDRVLYPHYLVATARLGISPLADQHLAGALMWVSAMVLLLPALAWVLLEWMDREEREGERADRRLAPT